MVLVLNVDYNSVFGQGITPIQNIQ